jgi:hypothetical protein
MSVRRAKRKMTGATAKSIEVILGERPLDEGRSGHDGKPQVRIEAWYDTYICVSDPETLRILRRDLDRAQQHLDGYTVILDDEA